MKTAPLVLFDIDGTLIRRAGPHHRQALVEAARDVTGLETTTEGVPVHGMLDPDILAVMLRRAGAAEDLIHHSMPALVERAQQVYLETCPDLRRKTCPGVRRLLVDLKRREIPLALVTGNLTRIGWKKMERAGLKECFRFGAFGEMASDRAGLVRIAVHHARSNGWVEEDAPTFLIGDSPNDIIAAQASGARSIAVYTGISTMEELKAHEPELLLEDLRALRIDMLLGS